MPINFRWDDIDGYDFTAGMRDQGRCGSCYTLSGNGVLESRVKIWYGQDVRLSPQHRLDCDFLNEGCHGGWAYIDSIFLKNFYAVDEDCAPYMGSIHPDGCAAHRDCMPRAKVSEVKYLGGHYGAMDEEQIIKELRARGPLIMDFNADHRFQAYHTGILTDDPIVLDTIHPAVRPSADSVFAQTDSMSLNSVHNASAISVTTQSQSEKGIQWFKLTHSVMVIGWGFDEKL